MVKLKCWKPSQKSSGFYKKEKGKLPEFIRFYRYETGKYDVEHKKGLGDKPFKTLATRPNKIKALRFAREYMEKHDCKRR